MPVGVAAAAALVGTGVSAYGASQQKGAASDAADAQSEGIQKGIDALTQAYQRGQGYLDPYYKQGRQQDYILAMRYGIIPEGLTAAQRKAYKKNPNFDAYKKQLDKINADAPSTDLPDFSRFDVSGLAGRYNPDAITGRYSDLASRYGASAKGIISKYDVSGLGDRVNVEQDPGYQFRKQQGVLEQQRMAAKRGTLQGGGFAKDLEQYAQGVASQEWGNAYSRLLEENQVGFGREYGENTAGYGREVDTYGREIAGNQLGYARELEGNQIGYGRAFGEDQAQYGREQSDYARRLQLLGLRNEPLQRLSDRGYQSAGGLSNLATSYGGNVANLFSQQGAAQAQGIAGAAAAQAQLYNSIGQGIGSIGGLYAGGGFGGGGYQQGQMGYRGPGYTGYGEGYDPYRQSYGY